ncbi:MAG: MerR family transcriptional regulator [Pseudomonadales bacterium]
MIDKVQYSIRELATEFGLTTRSIRFYEDSALLSPTRRGHTRIYSRQDRVRLKLILRGKRLSFSLQEIKELFDLWDKTPCGSRRQLESVLDKIAQRKAVLAQQRKDIEILQRELERAQQRCEYALLTLNQKNT